MRHKLVSLDACGLENRIGISNPLPGDPEEARQEHQRRIELVRYAVKHELTDRQREAVSLYFYGGMTLKQAGAQMGITEAVAARHVYKACDRLRRVLRYSGLARGVLK